MTVFDIAIIGAGPAGLAAGIAARARNKQTIIISNKPQDSPLAKSKLVDNYPGLPGVSGLELLEKMTEHACSLGCEILHARVITIVPIEMSEATSFLITTSGEVIEARTVIIAVGTSAGGKPFEGEGEFLGRGVSYCATCDGMLFRDATVCVIGLSSDAPEEARFLVELGATVHYLAPRKPDTETLFDANDLSENLKVHEATVRAIEGDLLGVTGVRIQGTQTPDGEEVTIPCEGVFILRPSVAPTTLLSTLRLEGAFIEVDASMRTSVAGVFAAGDCTGKPLQIAKAVGEGQIACFSAVEYLDAR